MIEEKRKTGIDVIGDVPWGTHLCQFYQTKEDLIDVLVPYFKTGLENNESCIWITSEPLGVRDAKAELRKAVSNLDNYIKKGQIEIIDYSEWYTKSGKFDADPVLNDWVEKEKIALEKGFEGLRLTGNTFWLESEDWESFTKYEEKVNSVIGEYRMLAICTYSLDKGGAPEVIDVVNNHKFALIRRQGKWNLIESAEQKQATEALRESEEKYRSLVNNVRLGIFRSTIGPPGKYLEVNPALEGITGYSREGLLHIRPSQLYVHPEERQAALEKVASAPGAVTGEWKFRKKDGTEITVSNTIIAVKDSTGKLLYFDGITEDITERKQAEKALRESEERYRALLNLGGSVGEAIVMLQDRDGGDAIQIFVSDEWPRTTGYSRGELLGMSFFELLHPRHREASLTRHKKRMSGEIIPGLFEMSIIRKDGTEVPIEITSAYTTYKGERANVAFIRDITERKQAEEREKELQQELNLSTRLAAIGELAAGIAHEINNPLTGVLGFSERLLRKSTDEEASRELERIHSEAQRAAKIVQNLLTFARRSEPKKEYLDLNDILQEALELRAYELQTSNIEVVTDLAPGLPEVTADFHQIQEVFLNIILNAEQVMTEANSGSKLSIKTQQVKDYVRISFTDDGPGIPTEQLDRVFDPFFTTREERGGTGLGLSACHGIVTEHGGKIYARSKPRKGATFFVELPLTTEKIEEAKPS